MGVDLASLSREQLQALKAMRDAGVKTPTQQLNALKAGQLGVVEHGHQHFYIPETGKPIIYQPFQQIVLNIMAGTHNYPTLLPFYTTVEYSTIKKCLACDTQVVTDSGTKSLDHIVVGDTVYGLDWEPIKVLAVTETMQGHDCYRLTFDDDSELIADADHLWPIQESKATVTTRHMAEVEGAYTLYCSGRDDARIRSVQACDSVPVMCIEVDSPQHIFQVLAAGSDRAIPTCNSGKTALSGAYARWRSEAPTLSDEILFFANDETQSRGRGYGAMLLSIELDPLYDRKHKQLLDKDGNVVWQVRDDYLEHVPTRTRVRAVNVDYRGEAGANPTLSVWCIDQETELLTDQGWMTYDKFDVAIQKVATRNPSTGAFEWQQARTVNITPFKGSMYATHGKQIDMSVTPNHRLWARTASQCSRDKAGPEHFLHVEEAARSTATYIPDSFSRWTPGHDDDLEPELEMDGSVYARFMGWFLSEGCTHKNEAVLISQSETANPQKLEQIKRLIVEMGYRPGLWHGSDGRADSAVIYDVHLVAYCKRFGNQSQRYVPQWLKESKYLSEFLAAYISGDGHLEQLPNSRYKIGTISRRMADDLQEIGLKLGYWVSSSQYVDLRSLDQIQHTVRLYSGEQGQHAWCVKKNAWIREDYDGIVWCPSTENGIVCVRRNGKVYQTGNTEAWGYDTEKQEILFDEMTPVLTRERSQRLLEGYAGYTGKSVVLEKVENLLTKEARGGRQLTIDDVPDWPWPDEPDGLLPLWVNDTAGAFGYLDRGPRARIRMPWLLGDAGAQYYRQQELTLHDPQQFDRLHNNYWISPVDAFIDIVWWRQCAEAGIPALEAWREPVEILECPSIDEPELIARYMQASNWRVVGEPVPIVLAGDASVSGDCTALIGVSRHPTPSRHGDACLRMGWKWDPPRGSKIDYDTTPNLKTGLSFRQQLITCCLMYNVVEFAYDEWQLHHLTNELRRAAVVWCRSFKQGVERDIADKQLYDLIKLKRISYDPQLGDTVLCLGDIERHISMASRTIKAKEDTKLHIVKANGEAKIDLVVALSMACAEALRLDL